MKRIKYFLLFVGLLLLTGCSERELSFNRVYPETSILEEAREKRQLELGIENEPVNLVSSLKKEGKPARNLSISGGNVGMSTAVPQYCWANEIEECESMQPIHPNDNRTPYFTLDYLLVAANEQLHIGVDSDGPTKVPYPSRIEAYIYDENKNLHLYEAIDNPGRNFNLNAPSKIGSYIFLFKAYYEGAVKGVSYHPAGFNVK